jgi:hypothetical protein
VSQVERPGADLHRLHRGSDEDQLREERNHPSRLRTGCAGLSDTRCRSAIAEALVRGVSKVTLRSAKAIAARPAEHAISRPAEGAGTLSRRRMTPGAVSASGRSNLGAMRPWRFLRSRCARNDDMISEGGTLGLGVHLLGEHRSGRPQSKQADEPPECPRCGRAMGLTRVVPSMFDQVSGPTTRTFACQSCGTTVTRQTRPER